MKIAIVHDYLTALGGAERVVATLHEIYPSAPIFTLRYNEEKTRGAFKDCDIRVAKLSQTLLGRSTLLSLPFQPNAIESFSFTDYDVVISSSSAFSKGILTSPNTLHICYCHTPMRFAWDWTHQYARENNYHLGLKSIGYRLLTHYFRIWDQASANRVDYWIANSNNVANRLKKYYRVEAEVIYPPVDLLAEQSESNPNSTEINEPYYLIVSRLSPYKMIDLAIKAVSQTKEQLIIIGEGPDRQRLELLARRLDAPVKFLGYQSDVIISQYYQQARAFLFTGEDDFGITPVEAMSFGKPVIAYGQGGALESISEPETGLFFNEPTVEALLVAMVKFNELESSFSASQIKAQAEKFSADRFKQKISTLIDIQWRKFNAKG